MRRVRRRKAQNGFQRHNDRETTTRNLKKALDLLKADKPEKISISSVAREAGVSPALVHNRYPDIAEQIRRATGKGTSAQRDEKHRLLMVERDRNRELREERDTLIRELRDLASENEALRRELEVQKAVVAGTVTRLRRSS